jgi:hypothetical protein
MIDQQIEIPTKDGRATTFITRLLSLYSRNLWS